MRRFELLIYLTNYLNLYLFVFGSIKLYKNGCCKVVVIK